VSFAEIIQVSSQPSQILGIDFSGAKNAGTKIWIAIGYVAGDVLKIERCYPAKLLPESSKHRDQCLVALRHFIITQRACVCGLDFPFGLPRELVKEDNWGEFILSFGNRYGNPDEFRETCHRDTHGRERRRVTDEERRTPFSPYNLRVYRQTYFGIRDVLAPLVRDKSVCVLPMQNASPDKSWIVEVCPASTLKTVDLYWHYKGNSKENIAARAHILDKIEGTGELLVQTPQLQSRILDDRHGDALDSVVAAFATYRALRNLASSPAITPQAYLLEGYVYV